jgi:galactoside O-acetyltransferase
MIARAGRMMDFLRKVLRASARWRLVRRPGVRISPDAKVAAELVRLHEGCVLTIGEGSIVEAALLFEKPGASITIGRNTFIGDSALIASEGIQVGDDVLMAWGGTIVDHDSHSLDWRERSKDVQEWYHGRKDWAHVARKPVRIGDKAWVGFNVAILKGVTVGDGAVIAACSVVTRDVPPYTLVAGNPARVVRHLEPADRSVGSR